MCGDPGFDPRYTTLTVKYTCHFLVCGCFQQYGERNLSQYLLFFFFNDVAVNSERYLDAWRDNIESRGDRGKAEAFMQDMFQKFDMCVFYYFEWPPTSPD